MTSEPRTRFYRGDLFKSMSLSVSGLNFILLSESELCVLVSWRPEGGT